MIASFVGGFRANRGPVNLLVLILALGLFCAGSHAAMGPVAEDFETIYDNTTTYSDWGFTTATEYGDEVFVSGHARKVTEFTFEYYGEFVPSGDEYARIRFYKNDGFPWPPASFMPGTVIWESALFRVFDGLNIKRLQDINVVVPENFTWTIEAVGLNGQPGDRLTTLVYDPPTVGKSFKDIWIRTGPTAWKLVVDTQRRRMSFAARVVAERESPTIIGRAHDGNNFKVRARAKAWRRYQLQTATHVSTRWENIGEPALASSNQIEFDQPGQETARFFRVVELPGNPEVPTPQITSAIEEKGRKKISAAVLEGFTYQLEARDSEEGEWVQVSDPETAITTELVAFDSPPAGATNRQYRLATVHQLEQFPTPEVLRLPLTNGVIKLTGSNVVEGQYYAVEFSTNLLGGEWKPVGEPIKAAGGTLELEDKPMNALTRAYRVRHLHAPKISKLVNDGQRVVVVATARADKKYALEYTAGLQNQVWLRAGVSVSAVGPAVVLRDNGISRTARYYRVVPINP